MLRCGHLRHAKLINACKDVVDRSNTIIDVGSTGSRYRKNCIRIGIQQETNPVFYDKRN